VDFNTGGLAQALARAGFDRASPAFFSWLGVSYYLPLESILETMRFIAGHEAPSEMMVDIALAESAVRPEAVDHHRYFRREMSKTAEPWLSWLEPQDFRGTLLGLGFTEVEVIDSNDAVEQFVSSYAFPSLMAFVIARKG
jgi:O-methyltransferase involved in polyketide biosynthesis